MDHESFLFVLNDRAAYEPVLTELTHRGFEVHSRTSLQQGEDLCRTMRFSAIFFEATFGIQDNFEFLSRLDTQGSFIILAHRGEEDLALKALVQDAFDVLIEPFTAEQFLLAIRKKHVLDDTHDSTGPDKTEPRKGGFSNLIAKSPEMHSLLEMVQRLAHYNTTVLITGESGTGKELIARAIHNNSPRHAKPFMAINCGAIPENLMEAELFGYRKGSFTDAVRDKKGLLEEANGGTVFLDEIGEMPLHLQVKLLRALQERHVQPVGDERIIHIDVRIIAATLRDLEADIKAGRFREDLYYRLNVVSLHVPPLRSRPGDITPLALHFIRKHAKRLGIPAKPLSPEVQQHLTGCPWKGNVRELENCIERALVMSETAEIDMASLPDSIKNVATPDTIALQELVAGNNLSIKEMTKELEISLIKRALKRTKGNRTHAAKVLEISHRALLYKMKEYGIRD